MAAVNILIAEDDAVLRNLYVKKFSVAGYEVRTAEDGEEALALVKQEAPDIAILDIHMPKLDGFQVLEQLSAQERSFPVIMLTNFADEHSRERGQALGADNYFVKKDMTIRSLLEMVEKELIVFRNKKNNR
jgi:DNA-binding response OmpR family regulator